MKSYNWTLIIVGVTGDLSKRKLLPALAMLIRDGMFTGFIIGTGREDTSPEKIINDALPYIKDCSTEVIDALQAALVYQKLDVMHAEDFQKLINIIERSEEKRPTTGRVVYCATASDFYAPITENLVRVKAFIAGDIRHRIVYEKPFGVDRISARFINESIHKLIDEQQIYRIDHYLAKEFVGALLSLRFANTIFKVLWRKEVIAAVKIYFDETIGIEGRGAFYDRYGALKDVMQNHVLQLLAVSAMDEPSTLNAYAIRQKKAEVLSAVEVEDIVVGQYDGYVSEDTVDKDSTTDTYAALKISLKTPSWEGVPFYMQTGKMLKNKRTEIQLHLKPVQNCLWNNESGTCLPNCITIGISPDESLAVEFNVKKPGSEQDITNVTARVAYESLVGPNSSEAYELLLKEIFDGNQSMVVSSDEIEYQWDIIDNLISQKTNIEYYPKGSEGPDRGAKLMNERV